MENSKIEAAYILGQNAGFKGLLPYTHNPFNKDTQQDEYFAFLDGHDDGCHTHPDKR